jgi:hypothetical protein
MKDVCSTSSVSEPGTSLLKTLVLKRLNTARPNRSSRLGGSNNDSFCSIRGRRLGTRRRPVKQKKKNKKKMLSLLTRVLSGEQ